MKTWAHLFPAATGSTRAVREIVPLDDSLTPGVEIFTPEVAADFVDVTSITPQPSEGWTTTDGGKTFAAPVVMPVVVPPQTLFAPRDFMALFTADEQTALFTARQTNVQVDMFITLAMAGNVDVTNAEVVADINSLVPANLLTAARAKQILAGQAPASTTSTPTTQAATS